MTDDQCRSTHKVLRCYRYLGRRDGPQECARANSLRQRGGVYDRCCPGVVGKLGREDTVHRARVAYGEWRRGEIQRIASGMYCCTVGLLCIAGGPCTDRNSDRLTIASDHTARWATDGLLTKSLPLRDYYNEWYKDLAQVKG